MAELIDKQTAIKVIAEKMKFGYFSKIVNAVAELPTTTESEIRAKAIDEFAEKCFEELSKYDEPLNVLDIRAIAEQLKEET